MALLECLPLEKEIEMTFLLFLIVVFYAPSAWSQDFVCG